LKARTSVPTSERRESSSRSLPERVAEIRPVAEVLHLFQSVAHGEPVREFSEVDAVEDKGLKDCIHGRHGSSRQILLADIETLEEFGVAPGLAKENITTRGIALQELELGQRLRVGEALLEVTKPCTPCHQMDEIRRGLQEAMRGRRGMMCRVVESGRIRQGDGITIVGQVNAAT
jgi:MOSC domain-containing protein YiiM